MFNTDYQAMSDEELVDRLEKGEMRYSPELSTEFVRRMEEEGTLYQNTPEDRERWKIDIAESARKGYGSNITKS